MSYQFWLHQQLEPESSQYFDSEGTTGGGLRKGWLNVTEEERLWMLEKEEEYKRLRAVRYREDIPWDGRD